MKINELEVLVSMQINFTKKMLSKEKVAKERIENDTISVLLSDTQMIYNCEVIHESNSSRPNRGFNGITLFFS